MDILVIGCGVSGLTTGLCLLEAGHNVTIWARDLPPHTTSNIAAAIWYPYKAYPADRVTAWGEVALKKFKQLGADKESGIALANVLEVRPTPSPDPWWSTAITDFRHARHDELPASYQDGYIFETPIIDTRIYLGYLMRKFQEQEGQIVQRTVNALAEAFTQSNIVVNCSGLGARELVGDLDLRPARGQVVRIRHTGFQRALLDEVGPNSLAYIVPRTHDIVLGGTYEENNYSTEVDPHETTAILRRCTQLAPDFAAITEADIEQVVCGLRPVRSTVRVEVEKITPEQLLIHNYGHGGAGITLSWGCAAEVVSLLSSIPG